MLSRSLRIVALSMVFLTPAISFAQSPKVVPANFILLAPPEFIGNPATGSSPNHHWVYVGSYATQGDCENAKGSMQYAIVENGTVTRQPLPASSTCLSAADYSNLN